MCRFIAYLGAPVRLAELVAAPENSLLRQSTSPRFQTFGDGNPDGWGVAWNDGGAVARHRVVEPMHLDPATEHIVSTTSDAFLAAIRLATPGMTIGVENTAPYVHDRWWFAHNGAVGSWEQGGRQSVEALCSPDRLGIIEGSTDSEYLFAAVLSHLDEGLDAAEALARVVGHVAAGPGGPLNLVLMDAQRIVASVWGNSMFHRRLDDGAIVVASEPYDDEADWVPIADRSIVDASRERITVTELEVPQTA